MMSKQALHLDITIDATSQSIPMPRLGKDYSLGAGEQCMLLTVEGQMLDLAHRLCKKS